MYRIALAGFMHESNTFTPLRTDRAAFEAQSLRYGPALLDEWRDAHHEVGGFIEAAAGTISFGLHGAAEAGQPVAEAGAIDQRRQRLNNIKKAVIERA